MFNLNKNNAKVSNLSVRVEHHGEARKDAIDLKLSVDVPAESLNDIQSGLCESIYRQPTPGDQISLIDRKAEKAFTVLRYPGLEPLKIKQKFPGYEMTLAQVGDEEDGAFFADAEVKNFDIESHEGGTTTIEFTVSIGEVDDDEYLALRHLNLDGKVLLTLTPPTKQAAEQSDDAQQDEAA